MYRTCLFCNSALGANESIEVFPVGRRLAFDGARGRLWVICPQCVRWNLSPLEIRWEAIEAMERAYRDTKLRAATDQIGLARLKDGTELVRIGQPLLPEFAAWRYGSVFKSRQRKEILVVGGIAAVQLAAFGLQFAGVPVLGLTVASHILQFHHVGRLLYRSRIPRYSVTNGTGRRLALSAHDASASSVRRHDDGRLYLRVSHRVPLNPRRSPDSRWTKLGFGLDLKYDNIEGDAATQALARLLPVVNFAGDSKRAVSDAVELVSIAEHGTDTLLQPKRAGGPMPDTSAPTLGTLNAPLRLALEMALHESDERRALEGELAELEARWREAEEIAHIADNLLLPADIDMRLAALKQPPSANP